MAPDVRKARDQSHPIEGLELVESRSVDNTGDDLANIIGRTNIGRDKAVDFPGIECGRLRFGHYRLRGLGGVQTGDDVAHDREGMVVVGGHVVNDTGAATMGVSAAEFLRRDDFASGGLHQWRPTQEYGPLPTDDHRLVRHGRHIGAARGARAHDAGDLCDPVRAHTRLIEEDAPEMITVGEDLGLVRQVRPARINEINAGQLILLGDLLRAKMLFHRHRKIGAALHRGVVGHDHALAA